MRRTEGRFGLDSLGGSVRVAHGSCLLPIAAGSARVPFLTPEAAMGSLHQPVLVNEIVAWLTPQEGAGSIIVDGTAGGGGHSWHWLAGWERAGGWSGWTATRRCLELAEQGGQGSGCAAAGNPGPRGVSRDEARCWTNWGSTGFRECCSIWGSRPTSLPGRPGFQLRDRRAARHAVRPG